MSGCSDVRVGPRGLRGCYVSFMDAPTRDFFPSRTEVDGRLKRVAEEAPQYVGNS